MSAPTTTVTPTQGGVQADTVRAKTTFTELFKHLWPYFMRHKVMFFSSMLAVFLVAIAGRVSVALFGYAIDDGILAKDRNAIVMIAIIYFVVELIRCISMFFQDYLFAKVGNRILFELRHNLITHVQSLPITYFEKNPTGRIVTRLTNDVVSLGDLFTQGLIHVFASVISLFAIIGAMAFISVKMTLAVLLVTPPLLFIVSRLSGKILVVLRESKAKLAAINAFVAENIGGMALLQLYGRVGRNTRRFKELSSSYRFQQMKSVHLYALLWPTVNFFNAVSVAVALYYGGILTLDGAVTTGAMVAFILHTRAFTQPLQVILEKYQILQNSLSGAERIFTLLDENPEESLPSNSEKSKELKGQVRFENVSFRYGPQLPDVLKNVSVEVKAGQTVALVGRTGSGKTTFITLLQRFYDPTSGRILIDGVPSVEIARPELRSRVGVVQQDTFMFRGTIAENIGLNDPKITRERIEEAARTANLEAILRRHTGGLDAPVEERGANLSQGERQLIAFARILAFDPDILILDEATASIDSHTEQLIQEATKKVTAHRTSFIIAHRISTILHSDLILVMDQGEILEAGSHQQLMKEQGHYHSLVEAQSR